MSAGERISFSAYESRDVPHTIEFRRRSRAHRLIGSDAPRRFLWRQQKREATERKEEEERNHRRSRNVCSFGDAKFVWCKTAHQTQVAFLDLYSCSRRVDILLKSSLSLTRLNACNTKRRRTTRPARRQTRKSQRASEGAGGEQEGQIREREERGKNARCWRLDVQGEGERQRPPHSSRPSYPAIVHKSWKEGEGRGGSKSSFPSPNNAES